MREAPEQRHAHDHEQAHGQQNSDDVGFGHCGPRLFRGIFAQRPAFLGVHIKMSSTVLVIIFVLVVLAALMYSSMGAPVMGGAVTGPAIPDADGTHVHEIPDLDVSKLGSAV